MPAKSTLTIEANSFAASIMAELGVSLPAKATKKSYSPKSVFGWALASEDNGGAAQLNVRKDENGSVRGAYVHIQPTSAFSVTVPATSSKEGVYTAKEVLDSLGADATVVSTFSRALCESLGLFMDNGNPVDADRQKIILANVQAHTVISRNNGSLFLVWDRNGIKR